MNIKVKAGSRQINSFSTSVRVLNRIMISSIFSTLVACSNSESTEAIIFGDGDNNLLLELPAELKPEQASPDVSKKKIPSFFVKRDGNANFVKLDNETDADGDPSTATPFVLDYSTLLFESNSSNELKVIWSYPNNEIDLNLGEPIPLGEVVYRIEVDANRDLTSGDVDNRGNPVVPSLVPVTEPRLDDNLDDDSFSNLQEINSLFPIDDTSSLASLDDANLPLPQGTDIDNVEGDIYALKIDDKFNDVTYLGEDVTNLGELRDFINMKVIGPRWGINGPLKIRDADGSVTEFADVSWSAIRNDNEIFLQVIGIDERLRDNYKVLVQINKELVEPTDPTQAISMTSAGNDFFASLSGPGDGRYRFVNADNRLEYRQRYDNTSAILSAKIEFIQISDNKIAASWAGELILENGGGVQSDEPAIGNITREDSDTPPEMRLNECTPLNLKVVVSNVNASEYDVAWSVRTVDENEHPYQGYDVVSTSSSTNIANSNPGRLISVFRGKPFEVDEDTEYKISVEVMPSGDNDRVIASQSIVINFLEIPGTNCPP